MAQLYPSLSNPTTNNGGGQTLTIEDHYQDFTVSPQTLNRVQTNMGQITATLPLNVPDGTEVAFLDNSGSNPNNPTGFGKNPLIINGNTRTIQRNEENLVLQTENASLALIYNASQQDWKIKYKCC